MHLHLMHMLGGMTKLRGNPWAVLATLSLGFFMTLLDMTIVNIVIPDVMRSLHTGLDQVMWVVSGYTLVLAASVVTASRLGDMKGLAMSLPVALLAAAALALTTTRRRTAPAPA